MIATAIDYNKCKIGTQNIYISGCRSLSQSPEVSFLALGVVENPKFAVGIIILSVIIPEISVSGFDDHTAFSDSRPLSQSLGNIFFRARHENFGLAVKILL